MHHLSGWQPVAHWALVDDPQPARSELTVGLGLVLSRQELDEKVKFVFDVCLVVGLGLGAVVEGRASLAPLDSGQLPHLLVLLALGRLRVPTL